MNERTFRCEVLEVPGADNIRDIGGYVGEGGRPVKKRRFLRAGSVSGLTRAGVAAVRGLGVRCIVDLRSTFERQRSPDTLEKDEDIRFAHIPMLDYIQSNAAQDGVNIFPDSMEEMYLGLLERGKEDFRKLLYLFAVPHYTTTLYHCTAGKDRTGLATMLLLGAAGVSREDIVEDYSHSQHLLPQEAVHPNLPAYLFESRPATMEAALDHLEQNYGGILPYIRAIGVDDDTLAALRRKLLD